MNELVAYQDLQNNILWANTAAARSVNLDAKELIGKKCYEIWQNSDVPCNKCPIITSIKTGKSCSAIIISKDGKHWQICSCPVFDKNNKMKGVMEITTNITNSVKDRLAIEKSEQDYKSLFENSLDGIYITTPAGKYVDLNTALVKMLGYNSKEELISLEVPKKIYLCEKDRPGPLDRNKIFQTKLLKKDGYVIDVEISSRVIYENDKPKFYQGIVRDITERKKLEAKLNYLSFHDCLTGFYNRAYFEEEVKRLNTKRQFPLTFIFGDINNLKLINDTFGHKRGDKLIKDCSRSLRKYFRKEDIIARWGGDEFAMVLPRTKREDAEKIIKRIELYCRKNYYLQKVPVSISFGIKTVENSVDDINSILKEAENNMYMKKIKDKKEVLNIFISTLEKDLYEKGLENRENISAATELAVKLGRSLKLPENKLNDLSILVSVHDIGKVAINKGISLKRGKLNKRELEEIKRHPEISYNILKAHPVLHIIAEDALSHHEWWDGSGYPQGIKGEDIPILSRIFSMVNAYIAMITGDTCKEAISQEEAVKELKRASGSQFEPLIVKKFINLLKKINTEKPVSS